MSNGRLEDGDPSCPAEAARNGDIPSISPEVLGMVLSRLGIAVQQGALQSADRTVRSTLPGSRPVPYLKAVLQRTQVRDVGLVQVRWRRFDQRRLPALVLHQDRWRLVEKTDAEAFSLTDESGQTEQCTASDLADATVLWLRAGRRAAGSDALSGNENPAAHLVLKEVFRRRRWMVDVLVATVVINLLAVCTSIFAMQVYDRVVPTLAYATLWTLVAGMGVVILLDWALKTTRARTLDSVANDVDQAVSRQVFDHVLHLQLDRRPRSVGTLAAQITGLDSVRQFFTSSVVFVLADMPFALLFIAMIALIGGSIAWVYALLLPVAVGLGYLSQLRVRSLMKRQLMRSNERQGMLVDTILGAESVRTSNAGWRFSEEWQSVSRSMGRYSIQQSAISNTTSVVTNNLSTIAFVSAIVVGVGQIEAGHLTMGGLIACSILGGRVIAPMSQCVQLLSRWQNVSQSLRMVDQVLMLDRERRQGQTLLTPDVAPRSLELEKVRFSYPDSPIQQISIETLTLRAGDRVALLGAIGSGKSTLLKVLAGLYRPSEGRVRLGDADLWEIDPAMVADHVAYLPQNVHLFKGTLRSNLMLTGAVSDSYLIQVCQDLGIDQIASNNPRGLDLEIFEGGDGLSGGQRQLVGLGRVCLSTPTIWLLDEPTASLDNETEQRVLDAIRRRIKPDDILVVSTHRPLLASQLANRILLLDKGEVVRDGAAEHVLPTLMRPRPADQPVQGKRARARGAIDAV